MMLPFSNSRHHALYSPHSKLKKDAKELLSTTKRFKQPSLVRWSKSNQLLNQLISSGRTDSTNLETDNSSQLLFGLLYSSCLVSPQLSFTSVLLSVMAPNSCSQLLIVKKLPLHGNPSKLKILQHPISGKMLLWKNLTATILSTSNKSQLILDHACNATVKLPRISLLIPSGSWIRTLLLRSMVKNSLLQFAKNITVSWSLVRSLVKQLPLWLLLSILYWRQSLSNWLLGSRRTLNPSCLLQSPTVSSSLNSSTQVSCYCS